MHKNITQLIENEENKLSPKLYTSQTVKVLAVEPKDLSSIPMTHLENREN